MPYQESALLYHSQTISTLSEPSALSFPRATFESLRGKLRTFNPRQLILRTGASIGIAALPLAATAEAALAQTTPFNPHCQVWLKLDGNSTIFTAEIANGITHEQLTVNIADNLNGRITGTARDIPFTGSESRFVTWEAPSNTVSQGRAAFQAEVIASGDTAKTENFPLSCGYFREEGFHDEGVTPTPGPLPSPLPPTYTPVPPTPVSTPPPPFDTQTSTATATATITPTATERVSLPINIGVQAENSLQSRAGTGLNDPKVDLLLALAGVGIMIGAVVLARRR